MIDAVIRPGPARPVSRKIHAERVLLLGWGRALLLQFAHPQVAQGIADHSGFLRDKRGRWHRLRRTLDAMLVLTYGTAEEAAGVARGINAIHDRVHGDAAAAAGERRARTYSAHDPELLRWVHATLVDSLLLAYERFVAPLSPGEKDAYCAESASIEPLLGIPEGFLPRSTDALARYMHAMLAGPDLAVTEPARRLARELFVPVPRIAWPLMALARLPAVGMLPAPLRADYGFTWSSRHEIALQFSARASRVVVALVPSRFRYWPMVRIPRPGTGSRGASERARP
jgi:uncharacterized protein (DUF2236 family)